MAREKRNNRKNVHKKKSKKENALLHRSTHNLRILTCNSHKLCNGSPLLPFFSFFMVYLFSVLLLVADLLNLCCRWPSQILNFFEQTDSNDHILSMTSTGIFLCSGRDLSHVDNYLHVLIDDNLHCRTP